MRSSVRLGLFISSSLFATLHLQQSGGAQPRRYYHTLPISYADAAAPTGSTSPSRQVKRIKGRLSTPLWAGLASPWHTTFRIRLLLSTSLFVVLYIYSTTYLLHPVYQVTSTDMTQTIAQSPPQQPELGPAWHKPMTEKSGLSSEARPNGYDLIEDGEQAVDGDGYVRQEKAGLANGHASTADAGLMHGGDPEKTVAQHSQPSPTSLTSPAPYTQPTALNDQPTDPSTAHHTTAGAQSTAQPTQTQQSTAARATPKHNAQAGPSRHILSSYIASNPSHTVKRAINSQFPKANPLIRLARRFKVKHSVIKGMTDKEWKRYNAQGAELRRKAGWKMEDEEEGTPVGELFWKVSTRSPRGPRTVLAEDPSDVEADKQMYLSLMPTLERDPLSGLTSPDLLGSTGTIPLTIISLIPDIMRHYHDVIIRAKKEVFLATNYWQPSNSVQTITNSLKELSELVIKENRPKIVVKIMYDRGSFEQLWNSHAPVSSDKWASIDLPKKEDVPGLDLQVIVSSSCFILAARSGSMELIDQNFHRVLLGTFHAKFLIVDRKVALINSNNIQGELDPLAR